MHGMQCKFFQCNNRRHSPLVNVNIILCEICEITWSYGLLETTKKKVCNQMLTYGKKTLQYIKCEAKKITSKASSTPSQSTTSRQGGNNSSATTNPSVSILSTPSTHHIKRANINTTNHFI